MSSHADVTNAMVILPQQNWDSIRPNTVDVKALVKLGNSNMARGNSVFFEWDNHEYYLRGPLADPCGLRGRSGLVFSSIHPKIKGGRLGFGKIFIPPKSYDWLGFS